MMTRSIRRRLAAIPVALALAATPAAAFTNRLIDSADPYLLEHAHNPVDWYPWGPAAFAAAKRENKPIFLSIGYSTCYWCHVAEKTIYSDPAIAAVMNRWFVNVKVDREERPDVDRLYIVATEMLTGHGAWPNNLFLTPDGEPFYAGSYFPPQDDGDVPGFPKVLAAIHDLWVHHRAEKVEPAAAEVMTNLRALAAKQAGQTGPVTPVAWLKAAAATLVASADPVDGGLGRTGPKFPQAPALALLALAERDDPSAETALNQALDAMAEGGIADQLAGGFFRYATDRSWSVPHFEKMLSDNAQLLALYAGSAERSRDPLQRAAAAATAAFLLRSMRLPDGGFATALDAQTDGVEGGTYLWTRAQVEAALGAADTERFLAAYEIVAVPERGTKDDGLAAGPFASLAAPGVIRLRLPLAETLTRAGASNVPSLLAALAPQRAKLLAVRDARPQPRRDDKEVVALNGMAIAALAHAGRTLGDAALTDAAAAAATRILEGAYDAGENALHHQIYEGHAAVDGDLADYALFAGALLDIDGKGDGGWHGKPYREWAATLADAMLKRFAQPDGRLASGGTALLPVALADDADADTPSGTSAALALLGRLGAQKDGERFAQAEARLAAHLAPRIAQRPTMWPSAVVALAEHPPAGSGEAAAAPAALPAGPATSDHVHLAAALKGDALAVTMTVDPGYHVNAHVPSLDYLVPTSLDLAGATDVAYPPPQGFATRFSPTPLAVYEGTVTITAVLPKGAAEGGGAGWHASVTTQACTAQTCLPPATIAVPAPSTASAAIPHG